MDNPNFNDILADALAKQKELDNSGVRFIIFDEIFPNQASDDANSWLKKNSKIKILGWQYSQARNGYHSICIMYCKE